MSLDVPPLASTLKIMFPSWNNFSTFNMKKFDKTIWRNVGLGYPNIPNLGDLTFFLKP